LSNIRVTYSGLISLAIRLSSVFTGLAFTLIVTRQLTAEEFGTWSLISGIVIYAVIINPMVNYWATRDVARGIDSGKTAFSTSAMLSVGGTLVYIVIAYFVGIQSDAKVDILLLASILIPAMFLNDALNAINTGSKPHAVSYGFLGFEITKIPIGLILVYFLKLGIEGAIYATFLAYIVSVFIQFIYAKEKLRGKYNSQTVKKWFKLSWLPTYRNVPSLLSLSDVVIFSIITGTVIGVAYYSAARTIGFLVNHTRSFSTAVYPKLLETKKHEYLQENLIQTLYFAFPISALSITLARPGLFVLNPIYEAAASVVIIFTIRSFLTTLNQMFFQALQGIEDVDIEKNSTFRDYVKSKLILYPTFQLIRHGIYIGTLVLMLIFIPLDEENELELVMYWALIGLIIEIPLFIYIFNLTKKNFVLKLELKTILKYALTSLIAFGIMYILIEQYLNYKNSIFEFLPNLLIFVAFGIGVYLGITYLIDNRTKVLFKAIITEIIGKSR
jgi:O-antigen/teichoic acid export membrane protein